MRVKRFFLSSLFFGLGLCPLRAFVLEDFKSTATIAHSADTGGSASFAPETGTDGNAVKLSYNLGTGSWAQIYKEYSYVDFAADGGNSLRFRCKATGSAANLEVKITDFDHSTDTSKMDKLDLKIPLQTDNQWRTYTVHFSSFTTFPDGTSAFNLEQVSRLAFAVTALSANSSDRGSGTVWLDKVELYRSASTLIDDFDDGGDPNFFGQNSNVLKSDGVTASRQYTVESNSGRKIVEFNYDVSSSGQAAYLVFTLANNNFQGYTHFSFKIRGNTGGEKILAKLESSNGRQSSAIVPFYLTNGITTSFQEVQIPISTFTAVNLSSVSAVTFEVNKTIGSGASTVQIDDLGFIRKDESSDVVRTIDELDNDVATTNWDVSGHIDGTGSVQVVLDGSVPGSKSGNRVYKADYSFKKSNLKYPTEIPYIVAERPFFLNIAPYSKLSFNYKGTGSSNNIEFKLTDSDDTTWVKKFSQITNTDGVWKTATFPLDQLAFFGAGTDSDLNMKKIKKVWFAVTKNGGTSGTFSVDTIEAPESGDFSITDGSRLISSFKIINNPFSPNGDKVKDECYFAYSLGSASKVNLKIHGLDGVERKVLFSGDQSSGEQSVAWDGTDSNGDKIPNGLYLYRLEAEGVDNRKDTLVQVIAVLK